MSHTKEQITEEAFWELFTGCILVCDTHVKQTRPYEEEGYHLKRKEIFFVVAICYISHFSFGVGCFWYKDKSYGVFFVSFTISHII